MRQQEEQIRMGDEQPVGYGNPPKESRFKKGQSGNRRGRPKGSKNLKTDLTEELQTEIKVREGPRAIKISKQRAIVKTLIAKTLTGDARAVTTLTNLMCRVLDLGDEEANAEELLSPQTKAKHSRCSGSACFEVPTGLRQKSRPPGQHSSLQNSAPLT
jgi:hypothetical protein